MTVLSLQHSIDEKRRLITTPIQLRYNSTHHFPHFPSTKLKFHKKIMQFYGVLKNIFLIILITQFSSRQHVYLTIQHWEPTCHYVCMLNYEEARIIQHAKLMTTFIKAHLATRYSAPILSG